VIFEIGHEASVRNKRTPEGFTHDWELFVRGADNTDIHFFIDKVVFHLHDTFPNPKRGKSSQINIFALNRLLHDFILFLSLNCNVEKLKIKIFLHKLELEKCFKKFFM